MIQFAKPLYLILLIPLGIYAYRISRHSLADLSRFRSRLALALRLAILSMLVLALAGAQMSRQVSQQCVVFALDVSDSIPKATQTSAVKYVNEAIGKMRADQKVALVVFGGDASVELAPSNVAKIDRIYSVTDNNNTDIAQALGVALAVFPDNCAKKIVLLSDGNETRGKAIEQAMLAGSEDVSIDVVPMNIELPHEALLDKMICPSSAKVGEPFDLKVVAVSKEAASGRIRIIRNGSQVDSKSVQLVKGKSVFSFQQSIPKAGNYEFKAILDCEADTHSENNVVLGYTMVKGKPKVLYVEGDSGQERDLSKALSANDIDVETRDRSGIPRNMAELRGYDMVVLSDVPATGMSLEQMTMIKSGVKDLGIGFTMIGGEDSFGAGGYFDTPIEEALPVDMSLRKTKVLPTITVVIVIDGSGSMNEVEGGRQKILLADDAAMAVVKLLQPIDSVAVVVCHTYPYVPVPLTTAASKDGIYQTISTIRAEGVGINVKPSMDTAMEVLSAAKTRQKHIILLADGNDCKEQEGVFDQVRQLQSQKVTVSTVAFGTGKDLDFLKAVAALGKGGYYLAEKGTDIKGIFTKDVMTVSKSLIVEEPFIPTLDPTSPELSGIDQATVPPLLGYVATSPKPSAHVSMQSHKKDPILATWQYGLGKSTAFTSDAKAKWAARWLSWPGYSKVWSQILRSTMRKSTATDFQTMVDLSGGTGYVAVDAVDDKGNFQNMLKFNGSVLGPDMQTHPLDIEQTGPGRYEATFDAGQVGTYLVNVLKKDQSDTAPEISVVNIPYPPEYKDITSNTNLLRSLAAETSGEYSPTPGEVFARSFRKTRASTDLWRLLVLVSLLLLPVDIAVRRLAMTPSQVVRVAVRGWEAVRPAFSVRRAASQDEDGVAVVSNLLESKKQRRVAPLIEEERKTIFETPPASKPEETKAVPSKEVQTPVEPSDSETTSRLLEAKRRSRSKWHNG